MSRGLIDFLRQHPEVEGFCIDRIAHASEDEFVVKMDIRSLKTDQPYLTSHYRQLIDFKTIVHNDELLMILEDMIKRHVKSGV